MIDVALQRSKTREMARRSHDEQLANIERQREDVRRQKENRNVQLFHYSSKEDVPPVKAKLVRQVNTHVEPSSRPQRAASVEPTFVAAGGKELKLNHGSEKSSFQRSVNPYEPNDSLHRTVSICLCSTDHQSFFRIPMLN